MNHHMVCYVNIWLYIEYVWAFIMTYRPIVWFKLSLGKEYNLKKKTSWDLESLQYLSASTNWKKSQVKRCGMYGKKINQEMKVYLAVKIQQWLYK